MTYPCRIADRDLKVKALMFRSDPIALFIGLVYRGPRDLFGKQKLELQPQLPIRTELRFFYYRGSHADFLDTGRA